MAVTDIRAEAAGEAALPPPACAPCLCIMSGSIIRARVGEVR